MLATGKPDHGWFAVLQTESQRGARRRPLLLHRPTGVRTHIGGRGCILVTTDDARYGTEEPSQELCLGRGHSGNIIHCEMYPDSDPLH